MEIVQYWQGLRQLKTTKNKENILILSESTNKMVKDISRLSLM